MGELGRVVVVAPHPDDESLGCGGLLALLAARGQAAAVIVMTDGARSHPNSAAYPGPRLAALREKETCAAVVALGLPEEAIHFLRYPDCGLPAPESAEFAEAAMALAKKLDALEAQTVLAPWRRDPHCDHVATWALLRAARPQLRAPVRWLEYPVWAWEHAATEVAPQEGEADAWRLDVGEVLTRKNAAVAGIGRSWVW